MIYILPSLPFFLVPSLNCVADSDGDGLSFLVYFFVMLSFDEFSFFGLIIPLITFLILRSILFEFFFASGELPYGKYTIYQSILLSKKSLTISAENPDQGSAKENLDVHYSGDNLEIGFNSRYLLDIAKQISGAQVKFLLSDKLSPTLIFDDDDKQALYLLMPMHI